ncbi:hypothetical protein CBFG_05108 [Clostridiales bacterium 1_7_47FAA]|nr:hypothetical protein CBFG_05108 [Clostridiales bacterium 1_7_47FAA]
MCILTAGRRGEDMARRAWDGCGDISGKRAGADGGLDTWSRREQL